MQPHVTSGGWGREGGHGGREGVEWLSAHRQLAAGEQPGPPVRVDPAPQPGRRERPARAVLGAGQQRPCRPSEERAEL